MLCADFTAQSHGLVSSAYAKSDDTAELKESEYEYMEMKPLLIPIINNRGLSQQINLVIFIEVPTGTLEDAKLYQPRLTDAFIQDLYGVLGAGYGLVNGNVVDVRILKKRMMAVTKKVLGEDSVNDVLLQVVQQHRL